MMQPTYTVGAMRKVGRETYADRVRELPLGKRVGGTVYLHRDAPEKLPQFLP